MLVALFIQVSAECSKCTRAFNETLEQLTGGAHATHAIDHRVRFDLTRNTPQMLKSKYGRHAMRDMVVLTRIGSEAQQTTQQHPCTTSTSSTTPPLTASATPLLLHRIAPHDTSRWKVFSDSWEVLGARTTTYHDEDLIGLVQAAFPSLAPSVARMRTLIEKTDIARLALMHTCVLCSVLRV